MRHNGGGRTHAASSCSRSHFMEEQMRDLLLGTLVLLVVAVAGVAGAVIASDVAPALIRGGP